MSLLVLILPFAAFMFAGFMGLSNHNESKRAHLNFVSWVWGVIITTVAFLVSLFLFLQIIQSDRTLYIELTNWFISGEYFVNFAVVFDNLTSLMTTLVLFVSLLVQFYSYFYMNPKDNVAKFVSYLNLFTFSMILLVLSDNLLQMFIGWEAISLCSYLLITFWSHKSKANNAGEKAFLVNRLADIAFILGIFVLWYFYKNINISFINFRVDLIEHAKFSFLGSRFSTLNLAGFLILFAACAKSAQIVLHIWLPDAMEAPTPVSALLHAATMVTAGVFVLVKLSFLYEPSYFLNSLILIIGSITCLYGAVIACFNNDIKKIIAYSTVSQLGYMFIAIGSKFYNGAMFHLFTHAFFKALLFLAAGTIIQYLAGEKNIKNMGGLWRKIPITYLCFLIGSFALIGVPGFSGYYSKEAIMTVLHNDNTSPFITIAFISSIVTILFTAIYSFRMIILVFHGRSYQNNIDIKEKSLGALIPLVILAIFSIFAGNLSYDLIVGNFANVLFFQKFANLVVFMKSDFSLGVTITSSIFIVFAFIAMYLMYIRKLFNNYSFYSYNYQSLKEGLYIDKVYDFVFIKLTAKMHSVFSFVESRVIDPFGPNLISRVIYRASKRISNTQTGNISFYVLCMLLGLCLLIAFGILLLFMY